MGLIACAGAFSATAAWGQVPVERAAEGAGDPSPKPIAPSSGAWVRLGGEVRLRFERASAPGLGRTVRGADSYGLHRVLLHADLHPSEATRVFVQLGAFGAPGKAAAAPPARDDLDVQQAFVDAGGDLAGGRLTARLGRQELALGAQRLVGLRDGPNARLNFDGARLAWRGDGLRVDVLALRQVDQRPGVFDNRADGTRSLTGAYVTLPAPGPAPGSMDLYLLHAERPAAVYSDARGDERRWSLGVRAFGDRGGWDWDVETMVQGGSVGEAEVRAWGISANAGFTHAQGDWRVRLGSKLDAISGDPRPDDGVIGTVNALYPRLPYLGSAAAFAPANLIAVQPELTVSRGPGSLKLAYSVIGRQTVADAVYVAPLAPLRGSAGHGGRLTAHQWSVDVAWRISHGWRLEATAAWVDTAAALEAVGAADTAIAFTALTWRF